MNKDLLISFEDYSKIKHNIPYFYFIQSRDKFLYYFGAKHTVDSSDPQFKLLKNKWQDFINTTKKDKSIVLIEGKSSFNPDMTFEESINNNGEVGAIIYLANKSGIPFIRPEPMIRDEINELLKEYSREEIFCFYILRRIVSLLKKEKKNLDELLIFTIQEYENILNWEGFDFSLKNFKKEYLKNFKKEFDLMDINFLKNTTNPLLNESKINRIARQSSLIRNFYILDQIEKYWNDNYNIFIVYGGTHAIMQEPFIRSLNY